MRSLGWRMRWVRMDTLCMLSQCSLRLSGLPRHSRNRGSISPVASRTMDHTSPLSLILNNYILTHRASCLLILLCPPRLTSAPTRHNSLIHRHNRCEHHRHMRRATLSVLKGLPLSDNSIIPTVASAVTTTTAITGRRTHRDGMEGWAMDSSSVLEAATGVCHLPLLLLRVFPLPRRPSNSA